LNNAGWTHKTDDLMHFQVISDKGETVDSGMTSRAPDPTPTPAQQ